MGQSTIETLVLEAGRFEADERTPFAETPWQASSEVIWREGDDTTSVVQNGKTFEYFLEPSVILELKEGLSSDSSDLVDRVIQYAQNDA